MSVIHLAKDPMELLERIDERTAKLLKELEEKYGDLLFIKRREPGKRRVKIYVITEKSPHSS